jgi:hypothetical protein
MSSGYYDRYYYRKSIIGAVGDYGSRSRSTECNGYCDYYFSIIYIIRPSGTDWQIIVVLFNN